MKLLFVAADPMEYRGMLAHTESHQSANIAADWARTGRMAGHEVLFAANGAGWKRAALAVNAACEVFRPNAVVSTGFCGALDPQLQIADVVAGNRVVGAGRSFPAAPVRSGRSHAVGVVASLDHVVGTAREKSALRAEGNSVVEMEASGVAARAEALGLAFYCVRAVTDRAGEDLANDFNAALRPDGHFDTMRIFRHALGHPAVRFLELFQLRQNCRRAAQTLGEFFADCRF
jgi:adenosylhomocysteine nucleosidase